MGDVPFRVCNGNFSRGARTAFRYFKTSCFVEPAANTDPEFTDQGINNLAISRGNENRNALTGPGINNWDLGLQNLSRHSARGADSSSGPTHSTSSITRNGRV
jgi:hypothetical protein